MPDPLPRTTGFLRARDLPYVDARHLGLTPAQYGAVALVVGRLGASSTPTRTACGESGEHHRHVTGEIFSFGPAAARGQVVPSPRARSRRACGGILCGPST